MTRTGLSVWLFALLVWLLGACASRPSVCTALATEREQIRAAALAVQDLVYHEAHDACRVCQTEDCCTKAIDTAARKHKVAYQAVYELSQTHDRIVQVCK